MKPATKKWVEKAEGDFNGVLTLRRSRRSGRYDLICFHCQQCAEKYLKARLCEAGLSIPKTHDLAYLLVLVAPLEPLWVTMTKALARLTDSAVLVRYPDRWATRSSAAEAFQICGKMRDLGRSALGA